MDQFLSLREKEEYYFKKIIPNPCLSSFSKAIAQEHSQPSNKKGTINHLFFPNHVIDEKKYSHISPFLEEGRKGKGKGKGGKGEGGGEGERGRRGEGERDRGG